LDTTLPGGRRLELGHVRGVAAGVEQIALLQVADLEHEALGRRAIRANDLARIGGIGKGRQDRDDRDL
jgi:hypothetical protein